MRAVEFIKKELNKLGLLDKGQVMTNIFEKAKKIEYNQRGYTKEDVLKAGEIGEINHHDYKHIVKLLDEAREINETYGSKGSDDQAPDVRKMVDIIKWIDEEILLNPYYSDSPRLKEGANMVKVKLQQYTPTSSQKEISDFEIDDAWQEFRIQNPNSVGVFQDQYLSFCFAIKWYREQLKKK